MNPKITFVVITIFGVSTIMLFTATPFIEFIYQSEVLTGWSSRFGHVIEQRENQGELKKQLPDSDLKSRMKENKNTLPIESFLSVSPLHCSIINQTNTTSQISCGNDSYLCYKGSGKCTDFRVRSTSKGNCSSVESYKELNKKRKDHLERICQLQSQYNNRNLHIELRIKEMFYFDKVQYGWCPSYKSASSNVISYICPLYYGDEICKNKKKNGAEIWRRPHFTVKPKIWDNMVQFVVVRDPFDRILSGFKDKIENYRQGIYVNTMYNDMIVPNRPLQQYLSGRKNELKEKARRKSVEKHRTAPTRNWPHPDPNNPYENPLRATFPEFISALISGLNDPHWTSVNNYCAPCEAKYDYVIKVDDFTCEFNNFLMATGNGNLSVDNTEMWATNRGPSKSNDAIYEYYSKLSYEQLDQFYDTYLEDCLLFDFNCEETLCKIKSWKALHSKS